jgi:hypothetical protein
MHRLQPSLGNKTICTQSPVVQNDATLPALTRQSQIRQNQAPCMGNIALHKIVWQFLALLFGIKLHCFRPNYRSKLCDKAPAQIV